MTIVSWVIFFVFFSMLVASALWSRRFVKDVASFLVAGRKTGMWLGLSNNFSGGLGLVTIAFVAQQGFSNGVGYIWLILLQSVLAIVVFGFFGFGIQRLRASKAMTPGQYHEMRFSRGVRLLVGIVCGIGGVLNMAIFPITGAKFLTYFLDWPLSVVAFGADVPIIHLITGVMIFLAVCFAVICGQVGVIITDYLQSIVIAIGLFGLIFLIYRTLGISTMQQTLESNMGAAAFNPLVSSEYGWQWFVWVAASAICGPFCFGPAMSRNASATNSKVVRLTALVAAFLTNGKTMLMLILGVGALVFFGAEIPSDAVQSDYSLVVSAMYIKTLLGPVMVGLLLSAFVAADVSTNDTYFLSWAGIWVNDVVSPLLPKPMTPRVHLWGLRGTIVLIGLFLYFFGVLYELEDTVLEFLMLTGTIWLGCGIAMIFGLYWKRACTAGAYGAIIISLIFPIIHLVLQKAVPTYNETVESKVAGLVTIGASIFVMVVLSLLNRKPTKFVNYANVVREDEMHGLKYQGGEA